MNLDATIKERHSVRSFTNKKPDWRKIIEAIDAARYAPSAGSIFTLKFIVVNDKNKINKLASFSQQDFISQCHYTVIVCSEKKLLNNSFPEKAKEYSNQQAGSGIQNFLLKLTDLGLTTCWIGAFIEDIKKEFDIPESADVIGIFPIGFEQRKATKKKKINIDSILYFNKYGYKKMWKPKTELDY